MIEFIPCDEQLFNVVGYDFDGVLTESDAAEGRGDYKAAVEMRWEAFQALVEALPDESVELDWEDDNSRSAIETGYRTGLDYFLACDWELSAAIFEQILEFDSEDHCDATTPLAYCYVAMGEWELYDETIQDISDKSVDRVILELWNTWQIDGKIDEGVLHDFHTRFAPYYREFTAAEHPADDAYLNDIRSSHPSAEAKARERWLSTEHIWAHCPAFIRAVSQA